MEALRELLSINGLALRVLRLSNCQLCTADALEKLSPHNGNRVDVRSIEAVASALRECKCPLTEVRLGANRIRDVEAATLLSAVGENSCLSRVMLGLECNALTAEGLDGLRAQLRGYSVAGSWTAAGAAAGASLTSGQPHGVVIDGRFQQPRCLLISDLCKGWGEHGRIAAILPLQGKGGAGGVPAGDVALFLAAAGGDLLRMGISRDRISRDRISIEEEMCRYEGHDDDVTCVAMSGEMTISGGADRAVRLWRSRPASGVEDSFGQPLMTPLEGSSLEDSLGQPRASGPSNDEPSDDEDADGAEDSATERAEAGRLAGLLGADGLISMRSRSDPTCVATLEGVHVGSITCVLATDSLIFSASTDATVAVWDLAAAVAGDEPALLAHMVDHTDKVTALALAFGALFTGSTDKLIKRWALPASAGGRPMGSSSLIRKVDDDWSCTLGWRAHDAPVACLAASEALGLLCSGSEDGRLRLWQLVQPRDATSAVSVGALDGRVQAMVETEAVLIATLCATAPLKPLRTLCIEPTHGEVLCAGASDGALCVWHLRSHMLLHTLRAHVGNAVRTICFGASSSLYVAGSDSRVVVWSFDMDEEEVPRATAGPNLIDGMAHADWPVEI